MDVRIILSFLWVATMLIYLLGDVLRIFAGDFKAGEIDGKPVSQNMWFGVAIVMVIPIIMIFLTLTLDYGLIKWLNIIVAIFFFLFNLVGIKGYKAYDQFLLIISFGFNALIIWYAVAW
jgi:hypothetical protein